MRQHHNCSPDNLYLTIEKSALRKLVRCDIFTSKRIWKNTYSKGVNVMPSILPLNHLFLSILFTYYLYIISYLNEMKLFTFFIHKTLNHIYLILLLRFSCKLLCFVN
ncbi:unnamed protein product [Spodoptera exigua]|nr:unnamed protein product [Spodoptera exigua]